MYRQAETSLGCQIALLREDEVFLSKVADINLLNLVISKCIVRRMVGRGTSLRDLRDLIRSVIHGSTALSVEQADNAWGSVMVAVVDDGSVYFAARHALRVWIYSLNR
jgi:hypothetical protein